MTNAQTGVTMTARSHLTVGLRGADATRFAARLWHRAAGIMMSHAITPLVTWMRVNQEMAELGRMDARELRDVGVRHADFTAIRQGRFQRYSAPIAERIVFNPESTRTQDADRPTDDFVPFAASQSWYIKWWLGD